MGAGIGRDCAVLAFDGEYCALSADPITADTQHIGKLAIHVNVNDIAASGCEPVGILLTILLPENATEVMLADIMKDAAETADRLGLSIIGGHTEITDAVNRPVVSAAVVGRSIDKHVVYPNNCLPGLDIVMSKWAGLEGTAILAKACRPALIKEFGEEFADRALAAGEHISVLEEARIATRLGVSAMHDATEGGVLGACYELAQASGIGADIFVERIPLLHSTATICDMLDINPLKLISSGAMIMVIKDGGSLVKALEEHGIPATVIGRTTESGVIAVTSNGEEPIAPPASDELYRALTICNSLPE